MEVSGVQSGQRQSVAVSRQRRLGGAHGGPRRRGEQIVEQVVRRVARNASTLQNKLYLKLKLKRKSCA